MPTDSNSEMTMYLDSKPLGRFAEIPTIELEPQNEQNASTYIEFQPQGDMSFQIVYRRMSRKRLVKRLMARGKSRNTANGIARTFGGHYASKYVNYVLTGKVIQ